MSVSAEQMEPLSGLLKNLHASINIHCSKPSCNQSFPINQILRHYKSCLIRGSYPHNISLHEVRPSNVSRRVGDIMVKFDQMCKAKEEDKIDVMFNKLVNDLKRSGNDMMLLKYIKSTLKV